MREYGIGYAQVDLKDDDVDLPALLQALKDPRAKVVALQRSRGYDWRASLTVERLGEVAQAVHAGPAGRRGHGGQLLRRIRLRQEPTHLGCDIAVGSLIKNPGGGLAPTAATSWAAQTSSRSAPPP